MPVLLDMSKWNIDNNTKSFYTKSDFYYKNKDAVEKVIRYISRTRWNETRQGELIAIGGTGIDISASVTEIIEQFLRVQTNYEIKKRGGRRLIHLVYSFSDQDMLLLNNNYSLVNLVARYISEYFFYERGYQVFYGIHYSIEKKVHIHFAVNNIGYMDGHKYHSGGGDFEKLEEIFSGYFKNVCCIARNSESL